MATLSRRQNRRGILLLIMLTMLVLFTLVTITFVVTATRAKTSAKIHARIGQQLDPYPALLDDAFLQLVRGSRNPYSSLQYNSLLHAMYGSAPPLYGKTMNGIGSAIYTGTCSATKSIAGGQMLQLTCTPIGVAPMVPLSGYYNGCVLTMLDGPAAGYSTRITGYAPPAGGTFYVQVMAFDSDQNISPLPVAGNQYLINGRAYSGGGNGFDPATGVIDVKYSPKAGGGPLPLAYILNHKYVDFSATGGVNNTRLADTMVGAMDYTAPDYNNPYLAFLPLDVIGTAGYTSNLIIPSFHRPDLIKYLGASTDPNKLRLISLRPTKNDNPNFTGSNPTYDPVNGPWDVDNFGLGVNDSVWIDLGFPAVTGRGGRSVKPMFAFLVLDLDGKININAHGNWSQIALTNAGAQTLTTVSPQEPYAGGGTTMTASTLPHGVGYGPAEINLLSLFTPPQATALLGGTSQYEGRYGENAKGSGNIIMPGITGTSDPASLTKLFTVPTLYPNGVSLFGTPPDLRGQIVTGVDTRGTPLYLPSSTTDEMLGNPYSANLNSVNYGLPNSTLTDNFFGAAEYERLLRFGAVDAGALSPRLSRVLGLASNIDPKSSAIKITPFSYDSPAPNCIAPVELRSIIGTSFGTLMGAGATGADRRSSSIVDLAAARLLSSGVTSTQVNAQLAIMLAPELINGVRMNINRPFGNGRDNDGDGVADNVEEGNATLTGSAGAAVNYLNNGNDAMALLPAFAAVATKLKSNSQARQIMARQLYCLAMLLHDKTYDANYKLNDTQTANKAFARRCAQWAINVVSFREPSAAMPAFEYDEDPWGNGAGWRVDGIVGLGSTDDALAYRGLVWGCKQPELLLMETLAFHDRRVGDTKDDSTKKKRTDTDKPDPTMDQIRVPQGSFFFELYCPHTQNSPTGLAATHPLYPPELFDPTTHTLNLGKMAPAAGTAPVSPIWRVAIGMPSDGAGNDFLTSSGKAPNTFTFDPTQAGMTIDRIVWFTQTAPAAGHPDKAKIFYNRFGTAPQLTPGRYAIVGPRMKTWIGLDNTGKLSTQKIDLTTPLNPVLNGLNAAGTNIQTPIVIIPAMDAPATWTQQAKTANLGGPATNGIGQNISEPLPSSATYYPEPKNNNATDTTTVPLMDTYGDGASPAPLDQPLDSAAGPLFDAKLLATGTKQNYRTVVLQRLANPRAGYNPEKGQPGHDATVPVNPYITVDWMPVDLTTFNGEKPNKVPAGETAPADGKGYDPDDPKPPGSVSFASRQRGPLPPYSASEAHYNVWAQTSTLPTAKAVTVTATNVFDAKLDCSLGFLNPTYGTPRAAPALGEPQKPFPWIAFNSRPYSNAMELLLVPASSSSRLLWDFGYPTLAAAIPTSGYTTFSGSYNHLLNFFNDSSTGAQAPDFSRVLDYVQVPSPFVGTDVMLNPTQFASTAGTDYDYRHPPFNQVSKHRDPGKINVNTATRETINALMLNYYGSTSNPAYAAFYDNFKMSRAGNGKGPGGMFGSPFRSPSAGDMVPEPAFKRQGVDCTLLRVGTDPNRALFESPANTTDSVNTDRNAFFRYQALTRLGNMTTTRSNVYAVWVTVGYFEVVQAAANDVHPDGYQLGQEVGADNGSIERHRAFFMYDRSIPVGYQRGENNNVLRGMMVRRMVD